MILKAVSQLWHLAV